MRLSRALASCVVLGVLAPACMATPDLAFLATPESGDASSDGGVRPVGDAGALGDATGTSDGAAADADVVPSYDAGPDAVAPCFGTGQGCCGTAHCVGISCAHCADCLACAPNGFCCPVLTGGGKYKSSVCRASSTCAP